VDRVTCQPETPAIDPLPRSRGELGASLPGVYVTPGRISPDDVLAADYISDWERIRPPVVPAFANLKSRVGTEVAHLSYRRVPLTKEALRWPVTDIYKGLLAVLQAFLANVPKSKIDEARYFGGPGAAGPTPPPTLGELPVTIPRWPFPK